MEGGETVGQAVKPPCWWPAGATAMTCAAGTLPGGGCLSKGLQERDDTAAVPPRWSGAAAVGGGGQTEGSWKYDCLDEGLESTRAAQGERTEEGLRGEKPRDEAAGRGTVGDENRSNVEAAAGQSRGSRRKGGDTGGQKHDRLDEGIETPR